jgi:hypothetical protein
MLKQTFAVINTWPEVQNAETEFIARLKRSARELGLECLEVDPRGRLLEPGHRQVTQADVDFAISLHFSQPKLYDIFSFVTLWNPMHYLHGWGYRQQTESLLTHDDFLGCRSPETDNHIRRAIAGAPGGREEPLFELQPSVSDVAFEPSLGERVMLYIGINAERVTHGTGRHQGVLSQLDRTGRLRIFGPKKFRGVNVWKGYRSYVGPLPFDGSAVIEEIHRAGIGLVMSSSAHREAGAMSMRLFETVAAGAVVLCDQHPFAKRYFGDSVLYFDQSRPAAEVVAEIEAHLAWIDTHPKEALAMIARAQRILREQFTVKASLQRIYEGFEERRRQVEAHTATVPGTGTITMFLLLPSFDSTTLNRQLANCEAQKGVAVRPVLCVDEADEHTAEQLRAHPPIWAGRKLEWTTVAFHEGGKSKLGRVLQELLERSALDEYVCVVGPNEQLLSNHLASLQRVLGDAPAEIGCAYSKLLHWREDRDSRKRFAITENLDLAPANPWRPLGFARFLFRTARIDRSLRHSLPYTDALAMHLLAGSCEVAGSGRCTLIVDRDQPFHEGFARPAVLRELEILRDYAMGRPGALSDALSNPLIRLADSFEHLGPEELTKITVLLAHSLPIPSLLKTLGLRTYRAWLRWQKRV